MFFVVSYDVVDDKRRNKLCNKLKDFGEHVQYSVFEADLSSELFEKMLKEIKKIIDGKEDNVRIYSLCNSCRKKITYLGRANPSSNEKDVIIV